MSEPFATESKKPGDMIRSTEWNRAARQISELNETKLVREGPGTFQGALTVAGDLEVTGRLTLGGVPVGAERGFGTWQEAELNRPQLAMTDGLVIARVEAGLDASGTIVGESPTGQFRLSAAVPAVPGTTYASDRVPRLYPDAGAPGDGFGTSVALQGDVAVIGAPLKDANNVTDSGCAFVYVRKDGKWERQARLFASDAAPNDRFGAAVAISGDTIVVGAPGKGSYATKTEGGKTVSTYPGVGATYVFVRKGTDWVHQAVLRRPANEEAKWAGSHSGAAVALSGDVAAIGAPEYVNNCGIVHIYVRKGETWGPSFELYPGGHADGQFNGVSVAISGDTVLYGAPGWRTTTLAWGGAVAVFVRKADKWEQQGGIVPTVPRSDAFFGYAVALEGDTALIGEPMTFRDGNLSPYNLERVTDPNQCRGSAYIFVRKGGAWMQKARLIPRDSAVGDRFGSSVALSGKYALVGALGMPGRSDTAGAVYLFEQQGEKWVERTKWVAGDRAADDGFGTAVALEGSTSLIGSPQGRNESEVRSGVTYLPGLLPAPRVNSFTMPVRSGDTWAVRLTSNSGTCAGKAYWLPVETFKK